MTQALTVKMINRANKLYEDLKENQAFVIGADWMHDQLASENAKLRKALIKIEELGFSKEIDDNPDPGQLIYNMASIASKALH